MTLKNRRRFEHFSYGFTFVFRSQNLQIFFLQLSAEVDIERFSHLLVIGLALICTSGGVLLPLVVLMPATCSQEEGPDPFSTDME